MIIRDVLPSDVFTLLENDTTVYCVNPISETVYNLRYYSVEQVSKALEDVNCMFFIVVEVTPAEATPTEEEVL